MAFRWALGLTVASVSGAVGSVTGLTASNLDATISSRMATYTQPTGFLTATFPGTVASTTNITADDYDGDDADEPPRDHGGMAHGDGHCGKRIERQGRLEHRQDGLFSLTQTFPSNFSSLAIRWLVW
jgi:hypothetical protein